MKEITKAMVEEKIEDLIDNVKIDSWMLDEISMDVYIVHGTFPRFTKMCDETIRTDVSILMSKDDMMDCIISTIKDAKTVNTEDVDECIMNSSNTFKKLVDDFTNKPDEIRFECVCELSTSIFEDVVRYFISDKSENNGQ